MYFRGAGMWQQLCTQRHNDQSTVRHRDDKTELKFDAEMRDSLFRNLSQLRFEEPFYYGQYHGHVFLLMFDRAEGIRFTHSPSGGGMNKEEQTTNPAWDFQYLVPKYEVKKEYGFKLRAVYRETCSRAEIVKEYEAWRKTR
jgi:hypothetical protein